jgi:hypothetical protein
VAAGVLDQAAVEDGLYEAAEQNGLVAEDGQPVLGHDPQRAQKGLQQPNDLDADDRPRRRRRRRCEALHCHVTRRVRRW